MADQDGKLENEEKPEVEVEGVTITIGDDEPNEEEDNKAPEWVRELRKNHRDSKKENRALKEELNALKNPKDENAVGPKPTLASCEFETDVYEDQLTEWHDKKREEDKRIAGAQSEKDKAEQAWNTTVDAHNVKKEALKVDDYADAEAYVEETFSVTQQGMMVQGADNSALVVYALYKNPKRAAELAAIKDPVKFAFAAARLEAQMKVGTRNKPETTPEILVTNKGHTSGASDAKLNRLRADAEKTGDYSELTAYNRSKKASSA